MYNVYSSSQKGIRQVEPARTTRSQSVSSSVNPAWSWLGNSQKRSASLVALWVLLGLLVGVPMANSLAGSPLKTKAGMVAVSIGEHARIPKAGYTKAIGSSAAQLGLQRQRVSASVSKSAGRLPANLGTQKAVEGFDRTTMGLVLTTNSVALFVIPTIAITTPNSVTTANNIPPISGTATALASVTVTTPDGQSCETTADASGNWTCTNLIFAPGSQTVTAVASNTDGVSSPVTASFTVVTPVVFVAPKIAITTPNNVTITSTNPPVSGTATALASVTVNAPNGQQCITSANASGNWTCTSLTFTVGTQTVTAVASTTAGVSTPAIANFTVVAAACAFPAVGGTAAYIGGAICPTSNAGTITLTGQTGGVVKWQTSTDGGANWTDLPNSAANKYYNFFNATNAQQFRAVLNTGGANCPDVYSNPATITTSAAACSSVTCDKIAGTISFGATPAVVGSNYSTQMVMTNASGQIQYVSAVNSTSVVGVAAGDYYVYQVTYDNTLTPLPIIATGMNLSAIGGTCTALSNQLAVKVCPPAPAFVFNCANATSSGAFVANNTAGQTGSLNLPITVTAPGAVTLVVSGTGFQSNPVPFATTLTAGQTSIAIPILYDGTGTAGTRTLTVTSASATGTCSPTVVVSVLEIPCTPVQPGIASASAASIQTGQVASFSLSQFAPASAAVTWTIVPSAGVSQASGTGTNTGNITFLIAGNYSIIYNIVNSSVPVGCNLPANSFATSRLVVTSPPTLCQTPSPGIATVAPSSAAIPVNGTASVGLTGGTPNTNISWMVIPSAGVSQAAGVGANTGTLTFTAPGLYQVVYTIYNAGDGTCLPVQNTAEAMISVGLNPCFPPSPITIISSVANNTSVSGNAVTFTAVGGFSGAMSWTVTPGAGASPANGTGNIATVNFGQTGGYVITFVSSNATTPIGCTAPTIISSSTSHTVVAPKLPPVATPDIANTNINTPVSGNVLTNDTDPQGGPLTASLISQPANGTVVLNPDGTYTYTPPTGFTGVASFCYSVSNTAGLSSSACVTVNVNPTPSPNPAVDNRPIANNDNTQTTAGTSVTINVAANDTDPDSATSLNGQLNTPTIVSQPTTGTATVNPDGTIKYTPPAGFTGVVTFPYQICDKATPALCATAVVSVNVLPTPPANTTLAPVAIDDAILTPKDTPATGTVAANDSDPQGLPLNYTSGQPTSGTVVMSPNGSYTYTPAPGYTGPATFTYAVCNSAGKCDVATVSVDVQPGPPYLAPIATPDIANTNPNTPVSGNVLTNDTDPQGGPLTVSLLTPPTAGTVVLNPDGSYTYTPPTGFTGVATFCYSVTNTVGLSSSACVTVNVNPTPSPNPAVDNRPIANNDNTQTTAGTSVTINVAANDTDPDSATSLNGQLNTPTIVSQPSVGTATVNPDGTLKYTPPAGFTGVVTFPYSICDKATPALCATAVVSVNVLPTPPANTTLAPVAIDDAILAKKDTPATGTVAANDTDPQGLPLNYTSGQPTSGTVMMSPNGSYTYTPAPGYTGPATFTYAVCNSAGKCDVATVSVDVQAPANQPPVIIGLPLVTDKGKPGTVCLPIADPDATDSHTATICGQPVSGTAAVSVNNITHQVCLTYTPTSTFEGPTTVCVQVCDNAGNCTQTIVPITVIPASQTAVTPQPPVVVVVPIVTPKDVPAHVCMDIVDPNVGDTHTVSLCTPPTKGSAVATVNNSTHQVCVTYTPTSGSVGQDAVCLNVCDASGFCTTVIVPVTIVDPTPVVGPKPPVVTPAPIVTTPDKPVVVCTGITDTASDTHTATLCGPPASGTAIVGIDNVTHTLCVTYTPGSTPVNTYVCVKVCDQDGLCTDVILPITVLPTNLPPSVTPDVNTFVPGTSTKGNVLTNDKDPEGSPLTATVIGTPPVGFTMSPDGSYTYTAPAGTTAPVTVVYQACDTATPPACATTTLTLTPVTTPSSLTNNAPVALNDATRTTAGVPTTVNILGNDKDPDGLPLSKPTIVGGPTNGTAIVNPDGTVSYSPAAGFTGVDKITYQVCDTGSPVLCTTAVVTVTVDPTPPVSVTNLPPVAIDDLLLTTKGASATGTVAANDGDPNAGQTLTYTKLTNPTNGTVVFNANGSYTYVPAPGFVGTDNFIYQVCDNGSPVLCTTATAYMTVNDVSGKPPVATPDIANTNMNTPVSGKVLTNDTDPQGSLLTASVTTPPTVGTVVMSPDGSYTYTPPTGFTGVATFCYSVSNTAGLSSSACVTINVNPVPSPNPAVDNRPIANNDNTQTTSGTSVTINVAANDTDPDSATSLNGQLNTPTIVSQPSVGTATVNPDGTLKYTPPANFTGVVTFPYSICDKATPALCATAVVSVNVLPTPPANTTLAPVAVDDALLTQKDTPATGTVAANDTDPQGLPLNYTSGQPTSGTVVMSPNGSYTYTPAPGYTGPATFTYAVCNSAGKCDVATVSVLVQPGPPYLAPIATPDIANTNINTPVSGNVLTNDSDPQGGSLTVSLLTPPTAGSVVINPDGTYTYTPPTGFTGTTSFCYSVTNSVGLSSSACVTINVNPTPDPSPSGNDRPIPNNDATQTTIGVPVTIAILANDTDPNSATTLNGQLNTPTLVSQPSVGTAVLNGNGTVTYTPPAGFTGVVTFPYQICDKATTPLCATALVTVTILPTPPANTTLAPVAIDDALLTQKDTPKAGTVATNDTDPQGLPLNYTSGQPTSGTVVMSPSGSYTYTPAPGYVGPASFTYAVCNSAGKCDVATVSILVQQPITSAVVLRLKVMLQGALIGGTAGLMRDDLRSKKFLPLTEPYSAIGGARFTHVNGGGGETMPAAVTALNVGTGDAVVDWVFVELRDPSNLSLVVATRSAMVQRDGDVVLASDGVSPLSFTGLTGSSFYVSVKHRNHI